MNAASELEVIVSIFNSEDRIFENDRTRGGWKWRTIVNQRKVVVSKVVANKVASEVAVNRVAVKAAAGKTNVKCC